MKKSTRRLAQGLNTYDRRHFMSLVARSALGLSVLPLTGMLTPQHAGATDPEQQHERRRIGTAKNIIYLYMAGGMSHLDTFDTKPESIYQGPVKSIKTTADAIQISEYLPKMAAQMKHVAVVSAMYSDQGAHAQGNYYMHTSYRQRATITHPTMGSWLMEMEGKRNRTLPGNVLIGGGSNHPGAGFMDMKHAPLPIGDPVAGLQHSHRAAGVSAEQFQRRLDISQRLNNEFLSSHGARAVQGYSDMYDDALKLMASKDLEVFNIHGESKAIQQLYGESAFGKSCLLARRLVENGVRSVEVNMGGWDTHSDNFETVAAKCQDLDAGMSALLHDLHRRGLLDETLVVLATEFGRSPTITETQGRNHHPTGYTCLLAGGGIQGGQRYGSTDADGMHTVDVRVTPPDFNATIAYALGLPLAQTIFSPSQRPFTVADKGKPLVTLF